jgi:enoyl-CoA hydratase/carnithine racemase
MTSFQTLRTDVSHRVATIWLNRPERRNAFSSVMTRELYEAFALFESAEDVRAIVVTGTGRYFSAGADLERGGQTFNRPADAAPAATDPAGRIEPVLMRTPVIADAAEGVTAFLQKRAAVAAVQGQGLSAGAVRIARGPA